MNRRRLKLKTNDSAYINAPGKKPRVNDSKKRISQIFGEEILSRRVDK